MLDAGSWILDQSLSQLVAAPSCTQQQATNIQSPGSSLGFWSPTGTMMKSAAALWFDSSTAGCESMTGCGGHDEPVPTLRFRVTPTVLVVWARSFLPTTTTKGFPPGAPVTATPWVDSNRCPHGQREELLPHEGLENHIHLTLSPPRA